jgi:hypothetical protein
MKNHEWHLIDTEKPHWQIDTTKDFPSFLRAVPIITPPSGIIYFENGSPDEEIESFFCANGIPGFVIPMGSSDPNPTYHMQIATENLEALAQIAERNCEIEIAAHIHIYCGTHLVLQWYDAFWDPIVVSKVIPEEKVKRFCDQLSLHYQAVESV